MSIIDDCVQFLEDLILGDFNEQQMVSAQIVGGVISLVPVLDQVMDVRDVSANLYRVNKQGGFANATLEQKIDFGFAAFGVIPEVGSAFKTVFKPLYKERKAAKGVINSGVAMVERMLGQKKGGAVRWVKALDWAGNTQAAILQANMALASCIAMLDYIGQGHWWCPERLERLARDVAPGLKALRGQLDGPIREAAVEIRKFLEDMLGEHAAAVAMAVAGNMASVPRVGQGASGHRPAAAPVGKHKPIAEAPRTQGKTAQGKLAMTVQHTAYDLYRPLNSMLKGLLGEHIVDHYVIEHKNWGLKWNRHDMIGPAIGGQSAGWQTNHNKNDDNEVPRKINDNGVPLYLCTPSKHVVQGGIDSVWFTNRLESHQYAIVEAKASMNTSAELIELLGEANDGPRTAKQKQKTKVPRRSQPGRTLSQPDRKESDVAPIKVMQMSHKWIAARLKRDFFDLKSRISLNYSRHVVLVTPEEAVAHVIAANKIISEGLVSNPIEAQKYADDHSVHAIRKEFGEADLNAANETYSVHGLPKRPPRTKTKPRK